MPTIRVRALKKFKIGEHELKKGELFYMVPAEARKLQSEGKVEMILTRYPERLEESPGWTRKEPCKDCPDKEKNNAISKDSL
jgi:hypothetical protein